MGPWGDDQSAFLDMIAGQSRGMYGNAPEPRQMSDINFGQFGGDPFMAMMMQQGLNWSLGQTGMMPTQFSPGRNVYDQYRDKAYWASRRAALAQAAESDRATYFQMMRGIAQMRGTPWGLEQQTAANVISGDVAQMAPILAEFMPETFDELHGIRGSATVMARMLHRGGRFGVDPITGRTGVSAESVGAIAREIQTRNFAPGMDVSGFRGIGMGRVGAMYEELQNRGMLGRQIGTFADQAGEIGRTREGRELFARRMAEDRPTDFAALVNRAGGGAGVLSMDEQINRVAGAETVTTEAIRNIQRTQPGKFEVLLRQFDAAAVARRVKDMSGAVGAMREIFGDIGKPNAPMSELLEGLNMMTQGGLTTMAPAELERMVRTTRVLAQSTGMGIDAMMGMAAKGGQDARALGLDPIFGAQSIQGAAAFGAAFAQVGRGDLTAWGRVGRPEMTIMDQQLRLRAAQSEAANRLGATMRIVEAQQGANQPIGPGLQQLSQAIREGRTEFAPDPARPGEMRSTLMSENDWRTFMEAQGVGPGTTLQMLRGREANQRTISQFGIADQVRSLQRNDVRQFVSQSFRTAAGAALGDAGVDPGKAAQIANQIGQAQAQALMDMPADVRTNTQKRNAALGVAANGVLAANGITGEQAARFNADVQAETGWGNLSGAIARSPAYAAYGGPQPLLDAHSREVEARRVAIMQETNATAAMQSALGGLGQAGPMQRIMELIQNPEADMAKAVGKAFNVVDPAEVRRRIEAIKPGDVAGMAGIGANERLSVVMQEFIATARQFEEVEAGAPSEARTAQLTRLGQRMNALRAGGTAAAQEMRTVLEKAGALRPGGNLDEAIARVQEAGGPEAFGINSGLFTALRTVSGTGMGIDASAEKAGIVVGAPVGKAQLEDVRIQSALLAQNLGGSVTNKVPEGMTAERAAETLKFAKNAFGLGETVIGNLLGNEELTKSLGAGGFMAAKSARDAQTRMKLIARELGMSPEEVLAKGNRNNEKVKEFLSEYSKAQSGLGDVTRFMAEQGKRGPMSKEEMDAYTKWKAEDTLGDPEQNRRAVVAALGGTVGAAALSPEKQAEIAKGLSTGIEATYRRGRLAAAVEGRKTIEEIGKATGLDDYAKLREDLEGDVGKSRLSSKQRTALSAAITQAGALASGVNETNVTDFLDSLKSPEEKKAAEGGDPGETKDIAVSGSVTLKGDKLVFSDVKGKPVTPNGATPAVPTGTGGIA